MKQILFLFSIVLLSNISYGQVGINTIEPKSTLDINGNISYKVLNLNGGPSGSATQINDGYYLSLIPSSGNVEFLMPRASSVPGRIYLMRNITDSFTAQLYTFGELFFSGKSRTGTNTVSLGSDNSFAGEPTKTMYFISDGSNWTYWPVFQ
jgi:hypothetical protein